MCISALVETELEKITDQLRINSPKVPAPTAKESLGHRRIEARDPVLALRLGSGGRFRAEAMAFNPYTVSRETLGGDLWASSLLSSNHGLIVLKSFADWVDARVLVAAGRIGSLDVHCAFNRSRPRLTGQQHYQPHHHARFDPNDRLLLVNFTPARPLLVPVLFDEQKLSANPDAPVREFIIVSDEPPRPLAQLGLSFAPLSLAPEAALEWLHSHDMDLDSIYFEEVLAARQAESFTLSLYKSA